jgi:hypothetical protein
MIRYRLFTVSASTAQGVAAVIITQAPHFGFATVASLTAFGAV